MRKAFILLVLLTLKLSLIYAQTTWPKGPVMVNAKITPSGELEITPSSTSSQNDFDFLAGKWTMHNKCIANTGRVTAIQRRTTKCSLLLQSP